MDVERFCHAAFNYVQTMKTFMLKHFWAFVALIVFLPDVSAQFDDVYYDPDKDGPLAYSYATTNAPSGYNEDVTYYDDDSYEYDDYDYYYSSRIRRFHRPYSGFDFYNPVFVGFNMYDPFFNDSYFYPGSSIYVNFGNYGYGDYHRWRRWNRWNRWNNWGWNNGGWNNWCLTPASYYYSYNSWFAPTFNHWGGYHGYYGYANYYNNYFNNSPFPVSYYNGITHITIHQINQGGTRGTHYGPRITGNTGSSPRGPVDSPGIMVQPVMRNDVTGRSNDGPISAPPAAPAGRTLDPTPSELPAVRQPQADGVVREIPVDREIKREETPPTSKRPVFRPETEKYQPYPTTRGETGTTRPNAQPDNNRPYTPQERPAPATREADRPAPATPNPGYTPPRTESKPAYTPPARTQNERPSTSPASRPEERPAYTPPPRTEPQRDNNDRPSYTPPPRTESQRNNDRPSAAPAPRTEPQRNNDRPSYSPPPRNNDNNRSSDRSSYSPSSNRSSSPSGGGGSSSGSRSSSGGSGGGSSSSPRGGRG